MPHFHCSLFAGILFTIDMFIRFHVAEPKKLDNRVIVVPDGSAVAKSYIFHGSFAIDFLATLPSWIEVSSLAVSQKHPSLRNVPRLLGFLRVGSSLRNVPRFLGF